MSMSKILCEVAGIVWKIEREVGDRVEVDDPIMIVESMKMEIPVGSWHAGRIVEICVDEGDPVEDGRHVATIEH
jgi:acetyl-CoA carboxylase biotin carboxyl carrier protein